MTTQRFWREFALLLFSKKNGTSLFLDKKSGERECKMSTCSSSGQKKNRVHLLFFLNDRAFFSWILSGLPWCKCHLYTSDPPQHDETWWPDTRLQCPFSSPLSKPIQVVIPQLDFLWESMEFCRHWGFSESLSICVHEYMYIYILDTIVVNWFSYTRVSIYVLLSYGIFIHFIIWG